MPTDNEIEAAAKKQYEVAQFAPDSPAWSRMVSDPTIEEYSRMLAKAALEAAEKVRREAAAQREEKLRAALKLTLDAMYLFRERIKEPTKSHILNWIADGEKVIKQALQTEED